MTAPFSLPPHKATPWEIPHSAELLVLIGTRKGAFCLYSDRARRSWSLTEPAFLGHIIHHVVLDPRDRRTLLVAARTGHLGPTLYRSDDFGKSWREVPRPPAFPKAPEGEKGRVVNFTDWLAPGHASEPGVWYAGVSPQALFRSEDGGLTWDSLAGFNDHPQWGAWTRDGSDQTPDGPLCHSVSVDPRDRDHLYVGLSGGGIFESVDGGRDWQPLNKGSRVDFLPDPYPEYGQDPHCMRMHPLDPDVLYQQNHCGIYRMERPRGVWERIGDNMPRDVGDIGFPIVLDPRDSRRAWVFPMEGTDVWPRTSPDGRPAVYTTEDSGASWQRQDRGLPERGWLTVKRQAMTVDSLDPLGIYFGTTSGELFASASAGAEWGSLAHHLPHIYSVEAALRA